MVRLEDFMVEDWHNIKKTDIAIVFETIEEINAFKKEFNQHVTFEGQLPINYGDEINKTAYMFKKLSNTRVKVGNANTSYFERTQCQVKTFKELFSIELGGEY